jgi:hypothetical protein
MARHAWQESLDLFRGADAVGTLSPDDLSAMSEVAFWAGHAVEAIEASQRACAAYVESRSLPEAAAAAAVACRLNLQHGDVSVASGWLGRVQRLAADLPICAAHGHLAWLEGQMMMVLNGNVQGLERAAQVEEIGNKIGDHDLTALGISMQGFIRSRTGEVTAGMRLIDEALAAAMAGELGPFATAEIFCEMVVACLDVTDFQRAAEWLETADRAGQDLVCFPGCCRVHRATVLRHRGDWEAATVQARQAYSELEGLEVLHEGMALCELGELYRGKGERQLAERTFEAAHEKGSSPQPGMALVMLANGDAAGASRMIQRARSSASTRNQEHCCACSPPKSRSPSLATIWQQPMPPQPGLQRSVLLWTPRPQPPRAPMQQACCCKSKETLSNPRASSNRASACGMQPAPLRICALASSPRDRFGSARRRGISQSRAFERSPDIRASRGYTRCARGGTSSR